MMRKGNASKQGLEQTGERDSAEPSGEHAPGPSAPPFGGASPPNRSSAPHGDDRSRTEERDPHICKVWPCPECHLHRDPHICREWPCPECHRQSDPQRQQQQENIRVAERHSHRLQASSSSMIISCDPEVQEVEQSESHDDTDVVNRAQGQNQKDHCSK